MSRFVQLVPLILHIVLLAGLVLRRSSDPTVLGMYSVKALVTILAGTAALSMWPWLWKRWAATRVPAGLILSFIAAALLLFECVDIRGTVGERDGWFHPHLQMVAWRRGEPKPAPPAPFGFRGGPHPLDKPDGEFRVALLGGSTMLNLYLEDGETIAAILEKNLEASTGRDVRVINAANVWYTSQHSVINYMQRVRPYDPDVVVVFHAVNDLARSLAPPAAAVEPFRADYSHFLGPQIDLFERANAGAWRHSNLRFLLTEILFTGLKENDVVERRPGARDWPSLGVFKRNMASLVDIVRADGVEIVLATQGHRYRSGLGEDVVRQLSLYNTLLRNRDEGPDLAEVARAMNEFNDAVRSIAANRAVRLVDFEALLPKDGAHFSDGVHMKAPATRICADALARSLSE